MTYLEPGMHPELLCHRAFMAAQTFTPPRKKPYFEEVVNLRSIVGLINLFLHFWEVICNMDTLYNTTILVDIYTFLENINLGGGYTMD